MPRPPLGAAAATSQGAIDQAGVERFLSLHAGNRDAIGAAGPIFLVLRDGNLEALRTLIYGGGDVNARGPQDVTPLIYATEHETLEQK